MSTNTHVFSRSNLDVNWVVGGEKWYEWAENGTGQKRVHGVLRRNVHNNFFFVWKSECPVPPVPSGMDGEVEWCFGGVVERVEVARFCRAVVALSAIRMWMLGGTPCRTKTTCWWALFFFFFLFFWYILTSYSDIVSEGKGKRPSVKWCVLCETLLFCSIRFTWVLFQCAMATFFFWPKSAKRRSRVMHEPWLRVFRDGMESSLLLFGDVTWKCSLFCIIRLI